MSVIQLQNVTKEYGSFRAIEDLSLALNKGEVFGYLGPNGAGKTTSIRILLGFLRATQGSASVLGRDAWSERHEIHRSVGYISGDLRLYRWMTLKSGLEIIGKIRKREISRKGLELAERFALSPTVPVRAMSRGMRQKVGLILALAHEPELLILDEPTTALDPPMKKDLFAYLRERAQIGDTVFFSSHTLSEVEDLCDSVAFIRKGKLIEHETLEVLSKRAQRQVVIRFEGEAPGSVPGFLTGVTKQGRTWTGTLTGTVPGFIAWCAGQTVADLSLSSPNLDHLFHGYYSDEELAR